MAPPSTPDKYPPKKAWSSPMLHIVVRLEGSERGFDIPRDLFCFYSCHFERDLNGGSIEGDENTIKLPIEDPDIFEYFIDWVLRDRSPDRPTQPTVSCAILTLAKLWIFGNVHEVPLFQNELIDLFIIKTSCNKRPIFDEDTIRYVWDNTRETAPLRVFMLEVIDQFYKYLSPDYWGLFWPTRERANIPQLVQMVEDFYPDAEGVPSILEMVRPCEYHVHGPGEKCRTA